MPLSSHPIGSKLYIDGCRAHDGAVQLPSHPAEDAIYIYDECARSLRVREAVARRAGVFKR